ncbi:hypothetical protein FQN55_003003 [Onygenales sp. PD_40]|nr:hypothetical protein FQN55_003003 [Onygenales sp. PD_40]
MSFLNSVLSSIETGDATPTRPPAVRPPAPGPVSSKSISAATLTTRPKPSATAGQKRRAEDDSRPSGRPDKVSRSSSPLRPTSQKSTPAPSAITKARPTAKPGTPAINTKGVPTASKNAPATPASPAKPPPKGSYAEMMLRAKALQEKAPMQVGMIKHQSVPKERLSKVQLKKRAMEAKQKEAEEAKGRRNGMVASKSSTANGLAGKPNGARAALLKSRGESEYKGTARPPPAQSGPEYKGTAGLPGRHGSAPGGAHGRSQNRRSRAPVRDEYLATDEEDEGDYYGAGDYDQDDYYSDESDDMEAGLLDVEEEEQRALRAAKLEDERELQAEIKAKNEKLERKKKLAALASKTRR